MSRPRSSRDGLCTPIGKYTTWELVVVPVVTRFEIRAGSTPRMIVKRGATDYRELAYAMFNHACVKYACAVLVEKHDQIDGGGETVLAAWGDRPETTTQEAP